MPTLQGAPDSIVMKIMSKLLVTLVVLPLVLLPAACATTENAAAQQGVRDPAYEKERQARWDRRRQKRFKPENIGKLLLDMNALPVPDRSLPLPGPQTENKNAPMGRHSETARFLSVEIRPLRSLGNYRPADEHTHVVDRLFVRVLGNAVLQNQNPRR